MSTLKVNKLRDTAGSADAITLDPNGGAVLAGVTTVTSVKVGAAVTISESGIEASGIGITCANINGTQIGGRRNLIINGAMNVAQRGTSSSTDTNGHYTIDRFKPTWSNINNAITQAQVDTSSGDLPYTKGFRKEFKITNGDNTPATNTQLKINYIIESQDLAGSGWDTVNSSSNVTLSFYVKSSVAQTFVVHLYADDSNKAYAFEYAATTSWTKITHTVTGASGLSFNNDNGTGLNIQWYLYMGTDSTDNSFTNNAWGSYDSSSRSRDMTNTWYDTNDATFEITGVQLEVGSQATAFEHRSFAEEKRLCDRYYQKIINTSSGKPFGVGNVDGSTQAQIYVSLPVEMRDTPSSMELANNSTDIQMRVRSSVTCTGHNFFGAGKSNVFLEIQVSTGHGFTDGQAAFAINNGANLFMAFSAEL